MPVIDLSLLRLQGRALYKCDQKKILETLPYLGLDIEGVESDTVSVEYSPNRPDYSSEAGIGRTLLGMLEIESGLPEYGFPDSDYEISVENDEIMLERPFIFGIYCELHVTEEVIKQLITMQEDLHNGLGRRRACVAIGIHNAAAMTNKIRYRATRDANYSFVPLGSSKPLTISEVLTSTEQGVKYGKLVSSGIYPILEDSEDHLLSMPPIINGERTRLKEGISKMFIDVTATDERAGDAVTAIIASMLADIGGNVRTVSVVDSRKKRTPDMTPQEMELDLELSNNLLGIDMSEEEVGIYLARSRIDLKGGVARIPRFRSDIIHPVDLAEEIALGYGISRLEPLETLSSLSGTFNPKLRREDDIIEALVGLGLTEVWNLSLVGKDSLSQCDDPLKVDDSKSQSYEYLRCDLSTSLLTVLGASTSLEYPQKIFEVAPVFAETKEENASGVLVSEDIHVCALIAGSDTNYTMARSVLDSLVRILPLGDAKITLAPLKDSGKSVFLEGRSAVIIFESKEGSQLNLGTVGEISPRALEEHGIFVPVAGFDLNLEPVLKD